MEETSQQRIVDDGANKVPFAWAVDTIKGQKVMIFKTLLSKKVTMIKMLKGSLQIALDTVAPSILFSNRKCKD